MPAKAPNQQQWTLRFKQHKTTVLLFVTQSQSFTSIKEDLLDAMKARGIKDINGNLLPSDPEAIVFGVPIDKNDPGKGWVPLEIPEVSDTDTKGKGVKKGSVLNQSPLGAGLKDGAMLAFKFRDVDAQDVMELDDEWDVVIPTYDEEDGSQSQGQ
ncbi:hypothetical protein N7G274_005303 [Stereocaulon virgatum]|uniref:Uncharacterized protein n=1 Tax=Stereocaulon virgatum TaxID=373712 RepID=A0ABR4A9G8_9LECA